MTVTFRHNPELQVNVLRTLACPRRLGISNLKSKAKIDGSTLKKQLDFLVQNGLIEKRPKTKPPFYTPMQNWVKPFSIGSQSSLIYKISTLHAHINNRGLSND